MRVCASSGTRPARSRARTTSARFARWVFAARRCRASPRCRGSCCARARAEARRGPRSGSTPGSVVSVREVGAPEGTCIEVADLFVNLPARRKFLKSDQAESAQISRLVTQMALGYPERRVHADERRPPGARVPARGRDHGAVLSAVRRARRPDPDPQGSWRDPRSKGSSPRSATQGRFAASRTSSSTAASSRTGPSRTRSSRPTASRRSRSAAPRSTCSSRSRRTASTSTSIPTKAEVRFLEQSLVHEVLRRGLADALGQGRAPELQLTSSFGPPAEPRPMTIPGVLAGASVGNRWSPEHDAALRTFLPADGPVGPTWSGTRADDPGRIRRHARPDGRAYRRHSAREPASRRTTCGR